MRFRITVLVPLLLLFSTIFICVFSETACAAAKIEVLEGPTYYLYESSEHPTMYRYYINLTLYNSGDAPSKALHIRILENEIQAVSPEEYKNVSIASKEQLDVVFEWPTTLPQNTIEIKYGPFDLKGTEHNSGSITLEVSAFSIDDEEGTPGFELIIVIIGLLFTFILIKKRRK